MKDIDEHIGYIYSQTSPDYVAYRKIYKLEIGHVNYSKMFSRHT